MEPKRGTQGTSLSEKNHKLCMTDRTRLTLTGIKDVGAFDEKEVKLLTERGWLVIKGEELHVSRLLLETGEVDVEGRIDSLVYPEKGKGTTKSNSILSGLFK